MLKPGRKNPILLSTACPKVDHQSNEQADGNIVDEVRKKDQAVRRTGNRNILPLFNIMTQLSYAACIRGADFIR
jgi:hypothetical protein